MPEVQEHGPLAFDAAARGVAASPLRVRPTTSPWLINFKPVAAPRLRLVCFPYAGVGASAYRQWPRQLPADVELVAIQPPGRESRIKEAAITDFDELVSQAAAALRPLLDRPFIFFGHSLGGIVCFEVARKLRHEGADGQLKGLIVSACSSPQMRVRDGDWHDLEEEAFIAKLRKLNGTPPELFQHPELLALVLPTLRADFFLSDTYVYQPQRYPSESRFDVPICAFAGSRDGITEKTEDGICEAQLVGWQAHTSVRPFALNVFPGDHFFIHSDHASVLSALNKTMREMAPYGM